MSNIKQPHKLIQNCVALRAALSLDPEAWVLHGSLQIPFCTSRRACRNEFIRLVHQLERNLGGGNGTLHWLLNLVDGDVRIDDRGHLVQEHLQLYFLISDWCDARGDFRCDMREQLYHSLVGSWRYEIGRVAAFDPEIHSLHEALGLESQFEFFGLENQLEISESLARQLVDVHAKGQGRS